MGKEESVESTKETKTNSDTSTPEATTETKEEPAAEPAGEAETKEEPTKEKKEDLDSIRKVIKVNEEETSAEEKPTGEEKEESPPAQETKEKTEEKIPKAPQPVAAPSAGSREELEQKRNLLQNIKDFDFQIKKNQEDVNKLTNKVDSIVKDLDDLVSLYEIVSEQMNPFVGLSKVTKKRIDALENFTAEIEDLKTRMGDMESEIEQSLGGIKTIKKNLADQVSAAAAGSKFGKITTELEELEKERGEAKDEAEIEELDAKKAELGEALEKEKEAALKEEEESVVSEPATTFNEPTYEDEKPEDAFDISPAPIAMQSTGGTLSDEELDTILSKALGGLFAEQNIAGQSIDNIINEFLLSLK